MAPTPDPDELAALRREYGDAGLDGPDLAADPVAMFRRWMHDTVVAGLHEPNAMVVSTVSAQGHPSSRMVLLKGVDERGFVFYTNYDSRKGHELVGQPARARCSSRGTTCSDRSASRVGPSGCREEESEAYFATRPRGSQLGAWASPQSSEVADPRGAGDAVRRGRGALRRRSTYPCRRTGAATWCAPRSWSSGRAAGAGCTTGSSTAATGEGWGTVRLAP